MFLLPAVTPFNQDERLSRVTELLTTNHFPN